MVRRPCPLGIQSLLLFREGLVKTNLVNRNQDDVIQFLKNSANRPETGCMIPVTLSHPKWST